MLSIPHTSTSHQGRIGSWTNGLSPSGSTTTLATSKKRATTGWNRYALRGAQIDSSIYGRQLSLPVFGKRVVSYFLELPLDLFRKLHTSVLYCSDMLLACDRQHLLWDDG
jgi:hypothetical protein